MAVDKLVDSAQLNADLASVANAIRTKGGTSVQLAFPAGFVSAVQAIPTGGGGYSVDDIVSRNFSGPLHLTAKSPVVTPITGLFARTEITELLAEGCADYRDSAFAYCTKLTKAFLTDATGSSTLFQNCTALQVIVALKNASVWSGYAQGCTSLSAVDFGGTQRSGGSGLRSTNAFSGCTALKTVVLRYTGNYPLANINNFTNTPFASGKSGGTLYVPQDLIPSYQSATNWSTILGYANNQILPIEGSIYETQYADGTPIS